jgi:hypothetical protein
MRFVALLAAAMTMTACHQEVPCPAPQAAPTAQLPTATEVFHLRTECAQLGDKVLDDAIIGSALTKDVATNYDPHDNRCYVDLTISTADLTVSIGSPAYYQNRILYDGQTHELLASIQIKNGQKTGLAFKGSPRASGFEGVADYINSKMSGDSL